MSDVQQSVAPSRKKLYNDEATDLGYDVKTLEDGSRSFTSNASQNEKDSARIDYLKTQIPLINTKLSSAGDEVKTKVSEKKTAAQEAITQAKKIVIELKDNQDQELAIQGGKRTRRMSKTRNRKTKNKRRKLYKR